MFEILVYTDTDEKGSLNGRNGFQFIGHSAGATPTDEAVSRDRMQHSVPLALSSEQWAEHPQTCGYLRRSGRMYLSRGRSTGVTIGGRPGNQLTVTVMTSDPADILPLSPAQLYSAPLWTLARPGHKDLEPWRPPLEIDPDFDVPALHQMIADDPWARELLPTLLTMLEASVAEPRVRLVIKDSEQRLVMRWVALLSKFLDAEAALGLEFCVFAEDPLSVDANVVGAHPLLSPDLTMARSQSLGINLLDLSAHQCTSVPVSEIGRRQAAWFLDHDPYDALDAVAVSRRWARLMPAEAAAEAADMVSFDTEAGPIVGPRLGAALAVLTTLAQQRSRDELEAYGDRLLDIVTTARPDLGDYLPAIVTGMWACSELGDPAFTEPMALTALEWAAANPDAAARWASQHVAMSQSRTLTWSDEDSRRHAAALLADVVAKATDAQLPAVFSLASSLSTGIGIAPLHNDIARLSARWVRQPALRGQATTWVHGQEVTQSVEHELATALMSGTDAALRNAFRAGAWDWLCPVPWGFDPNRPITGWFAMRIMGDLDEEHRRRVFIRIRSVVPANAWRMFLGAKGEITPQEVADWLVAQRCSDRTLSDYIERCLDDVQSHPRWSAGGTLAVLRALGSLTPGGLPPGLNKRVEEHRLIGQLFKMAMQDNRSRPNQALISLARHGGLGALYGHQIVDAILFCSDINRALQLTAGFEPEMQLQLTSQLERYLRDGRTDVLAAAVYLLDPVYNGWADAAKDALDAVWDDRRTEALRDRMLAQVDPYLGRAARSMLTGYLHDQNKGRIARGFARGTRGFFGDKSR